VDFAALRSPCNYLNDTVKLDKQVRSGDLIFTKRGKLRDSIKIGEALGSWSFCSRNPVLIEELAPADNLHY